MTGPTRRVHRSDQFPPCLSLARARHFSPPLGPANETKPLPPPVAWLIGMGARRIGLAPRSAARQTHVSHGVNQCRVHLSDCTAPSVPKWPPHRPAGMCSLQRRTRRPLMLQTRERRKSLRLLESMEKVPVVSISVPKTCRGSARPSRVQVHPMQGPQSYKLRWLLLVIVVPQPQCAKPGCTRTM